MKDIYWSDYEKFGVPVGLIVSSFSPLYSFGQMNSREKSTKVSKQDLARTTLVTITNNIGSLTRMCTMQENMDRMVFIANFLRNKCITGRMVLCKRYFCIIKTLKVETHTSFYLIWDETFNVYLRFPNRW